MPSSPLATLAQAVNHAGLQSLLPSLQPGVANGHDASALPAARIVAEVAPDAVEALHLDILVADWDVMFEAVRHRLVLSVGERLGELPNVPPHSAELAANLVQAVVLDCVTALDQLHAALRQERSQRPTT